MQLQNKFRNKCFIGGRTLSMDASCTEEPSLPHWCQCYVKNSQRYRHFSCTPPNAQSGLAATCNKAEGPYLIIYKLCQEQFRLRLSKGQLLLFLFCKPNIVVFINKSLGFTYLTGRGLSNIFQVIPRPQAIGVQNDVPAEHVEVMSLRTLAILPKFSKLFCIRQFLS